MRKKKAKAPNSRVRDHVRARGGVLSVRLGDIMTG